MATHVNVIAGCYAAVGVLLVMAAFFGQFVLQFLAGLVATSGEEGAEVGSAVLGFAGIVLTAMLLIFAVPFFITAWGLWNFKSWARIVGIILGVICLINVPLGTILGAYAMYILFKKDTEKVFVE